MLRLALAMWLLLGVLLGSAAAGETSISETPRADSVKIELIPDAWPAMPRTIGYEYNQKNHHETPGYDEGSAKPPDEKPATSKRRRYRVVGVLVRCGDTYPERDAKIVSKTKGVTTDPVKVKLGPKVELARYFVVPDDPTRPLRFELLPENKLGEEPLASVEQTVKAGRTTANPYDARFVASELNNEQRMREHFVSHPVTVRVMNDADGAVAGARITLLHDQFGLLETGTVGDDGRWSGRLLAGVWTAIAFGTPRDDPKAETVLRTPRAIYLIKQFEVSGAAGEVEMRADQSARVKAVDADGRQIPIERLTITPRKVAEALRFADVHQRCAEMFSFDIEGKVLAGALDLLTNKGALYDLAAFVRPGDGVAGFLHASSFDGAGTLPLTFAPSKMARYILDAPTGFGGGKELLGRITLLEAERQSFSFAATDLLTVYAPPGAVRLDLQYGLRNGDRATFVPRRIDGKAGAAYDLTPRPPFTMGVFAKQSRGIQIWIGIQDGAGQIVASLASEGLVRALKQTGETLFELPLSAMAFQFPTGLEKVNLQQTALEAKLRIGTEWLRGRPPIEMVRRYAAHATWATVPRILEPQADAFLLMVQRSCEGEKKYVGGPPGPVGMDFEVFLPPGVGGMGGGGMIQLDINELLGFVHETDRLPGAYCHELGHNVGFGHDPYMLLAPAGVEEGMWGALGYRMKNGAALEQLFRFLAGRRRDDKGSWTLSGELFGGLRLLYGPEVHRKMFEAQHGSEKALQVAGLSSIERIATLYTLAVGENVAWLFRAYGWPVFDFRVAWGRVVAMTRGKDVEPLNPDQAQIACFRRWWVQEGGGAAGGAEGEGETAPGGGEADGAPWQAVTWPTDFIALDQGRPPTEAPRLVRLFSRIVVPQNTIAYLVAASDVALEIAVNGHSTARLDASPQLNQPVHDELMLDRKRAFPVILMQGENTIDIEALQVVGSKGFILGLCGTDGKPMPVKLRPEGPDLDASAAEERKLKPEATVPNAGFEAGGAFPAGWIVGPGEPQGGVVPALDAENPAPGGGARTLRMTVVKPGTGAVMQRVVVEPGTVYKVRAKLRADAKFDGDVYVEMFTGDVNAPITKTQPAKPGVRWMAIEGQFASQKRRVVYICCFVKAKAGVVWFDDVELVREK